MYMLRVTHFFHYTSSSHSILRSNLAAIFACLSACRLQLASQFSTIAVSCLVLYIYIYIFLLFLIFGSSPPRSCRIPSLSSYTIATKKTVHPSIVNIIIYLFFLFMYIYILFSSYKHVFLPIIYLQFARDVASRAVNSNLGGGIYRPPRYLSIYLSSFDSRFRLSFVFFRIGKKRKRNDERTASARDSRAEKRIRESINTEKRSQPRRFRCWREASGEGRGGTEDEREER